jgi:two-component system cell cycle sensor histidine kinase/response regulator CckA
MRRRPVIGIADMAEEMTDRRLLEMQLRQVQKMEAIVLLAVTDTGCGMTPEVQARIFEPFFTIKGVGQGTRLGLAMIPGIVQQSGGHIVVHSLPGVGTTFKIYLAAVGELAKQPLQSPLVKPVRGSETILLIEDKAPVREITTLLLVSLGYQVKEASSGEEALRLAQGNRKKIDLLMTDVLMPGMSGSELTEVLRARDAGLKVLFLSRHSRDTVVRHGVTHTEVAFLQKPFTLDALSKKLRKSSLAIDIHHSSEGALRCFRRRPEAPLCPVMWKHPPRFSCP